MRKPRIIFFDIDGTLIDMEKKQVTPLMLDTLHRLQANDAGCPSPPVAPP